MKIASAILIGICRKIYYNAGFYGPSYDRVYNRINIPADY